MKTALMPYGSEGVFSHETQKTDRRYSDRSGRYPDGPVVLISSDYHMDRAVRTARNAGFSDIRRLPAPSSFFGFGANIMWEVILELNELTLRQ